MRAVQTGVQFGGDFYEGNKSFLCDTKHPTISLLSIVVKNIHMPRVKNTIPSPFFVVSLFVARLR